MLPWKRLAAIVIILLLVVPVLLPAGSAQADDTWVRYVRQEKPPAGWVHVRYVIRATWCNVSGECGTAWSPSDQQGIFERVPDRVRLAHGEGDDSPPSGRVGRWPRLRCADGQWAQGTWYHNSTWEGGWVLKNRYTTYSNHECMGDSPCTVEVYEENWTRMVSDYSNFEVSDNCPPYNPGGGGGGGGEPTAPPGQTPGPTDPPPPTRRPTDRPIVPLPEDWEEDITVPPTLEAGYTPPNPIVVQQDPGGIGVNLCLTMTTWPVQHVRHWYTCQHPPGQPEQCYQGTIVEHTETTYIPDPPLLEETYGVMNLTPESIAWIESVLGPRWGVRVYHPEWQIPSYPTWPWVVTGPLPDLSFKAYGCGNFEVEDPGQYWVDLQVVTAFGVTGHFPDPKPLVPCYAFGVTLVK